MGGAGVKVSVPVSKWRQRFSLWKLRALHESVALGETVRYDTAFRDGTAVTYKLDASDHAIWRIPA